MCGRVDIHDLEPVKEDVKKYYEGNVEDYIVYDALGYNIPPSADLPVWYEQNEHGILQSMHWAKEKSTKYSMINARSEDVAGRPAYASSFKHRRCLIPVNGFYNGERKHPALKYKTPKEVFRLAAYAFRKKGLSTALGTI